MKFRAASYITPSSVRSLFSLLTYAASLGLLYRDGCTSSYKKKCKLVKNNSKLTTVEVQRGCLEESVNNVKKTKQSSKKVFQCVGRRKRENANACASWLHKLSCFMMWLQPRGEFLDSH